MLFNSLSVRVSLTILNSDKEVLMEYFCFTLEHNIVPRILLQIQKFTEIHGYFYPLGK